MEKKIVFRSGMFGNASDVDRWLNSFGPSVTVVGYSAYGSADVRYHQEFMEGVFVTVSVLEKDLPAKAKDYENPVDVPF